MTPEIKPDIFALVCGKGEGMTPLNAFDQALLHAGIGDINLMRMSSIIPPGARQVGHIDLPAGALVPIAYGAYSESRPGAVISSAIAVALSDDPEKPGVIMEHEAEAPLAEVRQKVYDMAAEAFRYRGRKAGEIKTVGMEHTVEQNGAVFAGAVLWYSKTHNF